MNHLFTYVAALKEQKAGISIIEQVQDEYTAEDDGVTIENSQLLVKFKNGVMLRKQMEREYGEQSNHTVCPECWIAYEVLSQPENLNVTPKKKSFTNACQESFWLKINKAHY